MSVEWLCRHNYDCEPDNPCELLPPNVARCGWVQDVGGPAGTPDGPLPVDGTPTWAYDEDGYCVCCGYGLWKYHAFDCELRDALDALAERRDEVGGNND